MIRYKSANIEEIEPDVFYFMDIECECKLFHHVCRIYCFKSWEKEFHLEFRTTNFPTKEHNIRFIKIKKFSWYIRNVWWAIKGKPNTYPTEAFWNVTEMKKVQDFIEYFSK